MLRRWRIPAAATLVLVAGTALTALTVGGASAAAQPTATRSGVAHATAVQRGAAHTITVTLRTASGTRTVRTISVPTAVRSGGTVLHLIKPGTQLGAHSGIRHQVESENWSGYAADSGTYTSVSASWVQPTGTCSGDTDEYSSFWVGLDGYTSSTVEQTGTDTDCDGSTPSYYGWYETYPNPSYSFGDTINPGDTISASVTYEGSDNFEYTLADETQGWSTSTQQTEPDAQLSSAEVIIEAPCCTNSGGILPLADFGTVNFSNAQVDGSPIGDSNPEQIIMVDGNGNQQDSVSGLSDNQNFSATWLSSN
jgi:hypothetical protein